VPLQRVLRSRRPGLAASAPRRGSLETAGFLRRGDVMDARCIQGCVSRRTVTAASALMMICAAGTIWWIIRLVSRELTAVYGEGFRDVGLHELQR
jgi:hypothetical protein